jgi:hypothetical protein
MKSISTVLLLAFALSTLAAEPPKKPAEFKDAVTMCNGRYALCIKAPCEKTEAKGEVLCTCPVENGWNMGPNTCEQRAKSLTSTYSNKFNAGSRVLTCPQPIQWAFCYGASCKTHGNGTIAVCRCPVKTSLASILVSTDKCRDSRKVCSEMWSAAVPQENTFANDYYAWWMHEHGFHTLPPASACPATKK